MATVKKAERKFKIGMTEINFPAPDSDLQTNVRIIANHYPQLRFTHVYEEDAQLVNGCIVYPIIMPPVKTNG